MGDGPHAVALGRDHQPRQGGVVRRGVDGGLHRVGEVVVRLGDERRDEVVPAREVMVERLHGHPETPRDRPQGKGGGPVLGDMALSGGEDLADGDAPAALAQRQHAGCRFVGRHAATVRHFLKMPLARSPRAAAEQPTRTFDTRPGLA